MYVVLIGWNVSVVSKLLQVFVSSRGAIVGRSMSPYSVSPFVQCRHVKYRTVEGPTTPQWKQAC